MQLSKQIKNFIRKLVKSKKPLSEERYYKHLFVKNSYWNKPTPNGEEILRWEIIQKFMRQIVSVTDNVELQMVDIGCGRGWLTHLLSPYGKIIGVEPVKPVVKHATKMFPSIEFICGTTQTLLTKKNVYANSFNLVVTSEVIEHIHDLKKEAFIDEISQLLTTQGYLIITTPRAEAQQEWNSYQTTDQPIEDWMTENELEQLLVKMNFKKVALERIALKPTSNAKEIDIYQLWLFQKMN